MDKSTFQNFRSFMRQYSPAAGGSVLDVGSYDVNGTLKPLCAHLIYTGLDIEAGPNVDLVVPLGSDWPLLRGFDLVVSSSCFEHDPMFWVTFSRMVEATVIGGYIYVNAPSSGMYHGYPVDCWRFYKDAWDALAKWDGRAKVIEQYIDTSTHQKSNIGVFQRTK